MNHRPIAFVSGGSSGIGLAFLRELNSRGYEVVFCARDAAKIAKVEESLTGARGYVCDVADRTAVAGTARKVLTDHTSIALLVSNAGGLDGNDFTATDLSSADLSSELRSNLEGAVNLVAEFLPGLRRAKGARIVIVSSGYGLAPATRAPLYSAAKAGLRAFAKALRRQLAPLGIQVTDVAPPLVDTPAVAHLAEKKLSPDVVVRQTLDAVEKGRNEVYPGAVRWLPLMLRLAPRLAERIVAG